MMKHIEIHELMWGKHRYQHDLDWNEETKDSKKHKIPEKPFLWGAHHDRGIKSTAFCLDGDEPRGRTLWHLRRIAEGAAGLFHVATRQVGETYEAWWHGTSIFFNV